MEFLMLDKQSELALVDATVKPLAKDRRRPTNSIRGAGDVTKGSPMRKSNYRISFL